LGIQAPILGRWIDRNGPQRSIGGTLAVHVLAVVALIWVAHGMADAKPVGTVPSLVDSLKLAWPLLLCCALAGASMPPVSAIFRAVLRKNPLPDAQRHAAFALDGVLVELCFIAGPLIAAAFAATSQVWIALVISGVMAIFGGWLFVRAGGYRLWGTPEPLGEGAQDRLGPLRLKPVRRVLWAMLVFGIGIGFMEMGLTAATAMLGKPAAIGWAFAALAFTSAVAGLWHGSVHVKATKGVQFALSCTWLGVGSVAFALSPGLTVLLALCWIVGFGFAPGFTAIHSAMAEVAPPAQSTEAFTWLGTLVLVGIGVGWSVSGWLAEALSWRAPFVVSAACMGVAALYGLRMRQVPQPQPQRPMIQ
jgi:MFS family permease